MSPVDTAAAVDKIAAARMAKEVSHSDGCPSERMESFDRTRPKDRQIVTVTRCIDCGGQRIDPTGKFDIEERKDA